ncbi:rnd [Symbiodinium microadriaticum]|nr:rnd [Symbiodinium microadriaticum]
MIIVKDTPHLATICKSLADEDFVTVDTEFIREKTYWPELCLIQIAGDDDAYIIDPLADDMDLAPFFELMADKSVLKVFHAAKQDIEIFVNLSGNVPTPLFDTQIAAMVCGFGDQIGYQPLIRTLTGAKLDKSSRFTDWARRPLTDRQLDYALADVTHLRKAYRKLSKQLESSGRKGWVAEEMEVLEAISTYVIDPDTCWERIKARSTNPRFLAILKALAAWRERKAQSANQPRNRILKDDALLEIAAHNPKTKTELRNLRAVSKGLVDGRWGDSLMSTIEEAAALPTEDCPQVERKKGVPASAQPIIEMLRVLLKQVTAAHDVAPKLIASAADLERIACEDDPDVLALHGWRAEIFGDQAQAMKRGELGLALKDGRVSLVDI